MVKFLKDQCNAAVKREMKRIAPAFVQNDFGTKIIDPQKAELWRSIAQLNVLSKMAVAIYALILITQITLIWKTL